MLIPFRPKFGRLLLTMSCPMCHQLRPKLSALPSLTCMLTPMTVNVVVVCGGKGTALLRWSPERQI
jgi:hypothetical protein